MKGGTDEIKLKRVPKTIKTHKRLFVYLFAQFLVIKFM